MSRRIRYVGLCLAALVLGTAFTHADEPAAEKKVEPKITKKAVKAVDTAVEKAEPAAKPDVAEKKVAGEEAPSKTAKPTATPAVHVVKKGPLKVTLELDGVFESKTAYEIAVAPEEWAKLTVLSAAPHGARVRKGDVLLQLKTDKLDRAIADLRTDLKISDVALQQGGEQLQALEKTTPLDLEAGQRNARTAEEDRKSFFDTVRPFNWKAAEFHLKNANASLEYEEEELRQLEKMYKADDITEETEAIVLKRARDGVERAKFSAELARINHDLAVKFSLPRTDENVQESARRAQLAWEKKRVELPLALQKQKLEMKKLRVKRSLSEEKLQRLLVDRKMMTVKSPADGIVYYGQCLRGRPANSDALAKALRRNGTIQPNQVVMTVIQPRPMRICATVPEAKLHDLYPGLKGIATPTGYPKLKLPVTFDRASDIPISPGNFDVRLTVNLKGKTKLLMPGMTCKVKLVAYLKKNALTVPPKALVTDELNEQKQSVQVLGKDGKPKNRPVTVGRKTTEKVEILKGLHEGDRVVLEPKKGQT